LIDVVTIAYRSGRYLRACVEPLSRTPGVRTIVVDNACPEHSAETVADLDVRLVRMSRNVGFAAGCNAGAAAGSGDVILFLNPDAEMRPSEVEGLGELFDEDPTLGAIGPRILEASGEVQPSMRRTPRLLAAFGEALFLQHLFRRSAWPTEIVRAGYGEARSSEWLSGAVLCVRRVAFEQVGGFDERFFMYCEDTDLCLRLRRAGFEVRYDPAATAMHVGGGSAPRPLQAAQRVSGRLLYARLHESGFRYLAFRAAFVLFELLRLPVGAVRSSSHLQGRLDALLVTLGIGPRKAGAAADPVGPVLESEGEREIAPIG